MRIKKVTVIIICLLVLGISVSEIVMEKKNYSENENRHLAETPELTFSTIKSKAFMSDIEEYLCDHFPMRDQFMTVYALAQKAGGYTEINGVYLCQDGYLIEKPTEYENLDMIADKLSVLRQKIDSIKTGINLDIMLVPTSITVNQDKLPANSASNIQLEAIKTIEGNSEGNINYINITDTLMEHNEYQQMFYRTDHHWTTYAAYYAYEEYCKSKGLESIPVGEYSIENVSDEFYGTVYSKVNNMTVSPDTITAFIRSAQDLTVTYQNGSSDSLYNYDYLKVKDKYSFFLNNINDIVTIENNNCHNGKKLIVAKDSYANCFIPFLVDHYEKIIVLDTRYYMYGITPLIEKNGITDILILYNMNTIDTDTGINGIY